MPRYKIVLEYDGTNYAGWQIQPNAPSVQAAVQQAIYRFCQANTTLYAAGRTDAGVHARGQVAHFDLQKTIAADRMLAALNYYLKGAAISVIEAREVAPHFHARFDATLREYQYIILNRPSPPAVHRGYVWHFKYPLQLDLMQKAASDFIGTHNLSSFRAADCQARCPIKTINLCGVSAQGEQIQIDVAARSFMHNQVRIMVGCLVAIGSGRRPINYIRQLLEVGNRSLAAQTAPAEGLYFMKVHYDL